MAAAAAITQTLGGTLNCGVQTHIVYCGQLSALEGFAWIIWCVVVSLRHMMLTPTCLWCSNQGGVDLDACVCAHPEHPVSTSGRIRDRVLIVGTLVTFNIRRYQRRIFSFKLSFLSNTVKINCFVRSGSLL